MTGRTLEEIRAYLAVVNANYLADRAATEADHDRLAKALAEAVREFSRLTLSGKGGRNDRPPGR